MEYNDSTWIRRAVGLVRFIILQMYSFGVLGLID
jgi:hypothetical protein